MRGTPCTSVGLAVIVFLAAGPALSQWSSDSQEVPSKVKSGFEEASKEELPVEETRKGPSWMDAEAAIDDILAGHDEETPEWTPIIEAPSGPGVMLMHFFLGGVPAALRAGPFTSAISSQVYVNPAAFVFVGLFVPNAIVDLDVVRSIWQDRWLPGGESGDWSESRVRSDAGFAPSLLSSYPMPGATNLNTDGEGVTFLLAAGYDAGSMFRRHALTLSEARDEWSLVRGSASEAATSLHSVVTSAGFTGTVINLDTIFAIPVQPRPSVILQTHASLSEHFLTINIGRTRLAFSPHFRQTMLLSLRKGRDLDNHFAFWDYRLYFLAAFRSQWFDVGVGGGYAFHQEWSNRIRVGAYDQQLARIFTPMLTSYLEAFPVGPWFAVYGALDIDFAVKGIPLRFGARTHPVKWLTLEVSVFQWFGSESDELWRPTFLATFQL